MKEITMGYADVTVLGRGNLILFQGKAVRVEWQDPTDPERFAGRSASPHLIELSDAATELVEDYDNGESDPEAVARLAKAVAFLEFETAIVEPLRLEQAPPPEVEPHVEVKHLADMADTFGDFLEAFSDRPGFGGDMVRAIVTTWREQCTQALGRGAIARGRAEAAATVLDGDDLENVLAADEADERRWLARTAEKLHEVEAVVRITRKVIEASHSAKHGLLDRLEELEAALEALDAGGADFGVEPTMTAAEALDVLVPIAEGQPNGLCPHDVPENQPCDACNAEAGGAKSIG